MRNARVRNIWIILVTFVVSRIILVFFDVHFDFSTLYTYWQYLDVETLQENLLAGVWYDHTQPPAFNLLLGILLKTAGIKYAPFVFAGLFKLISLVNALLLYTLLRQVTGHPKIPLILSLVYLVSPAALVLENELFYTSFISMLFMISCFFLLRFPKSIGWNTIAGFFIPLILICLTRSMYHLLLLPVLSLSIYIYYSKKQGAIKLIAAATVSFLLVGSWYVKNYIIFGKFSTSSWMGMNMSRNVFQDGEIIDSPGIESLLPFKERSLYKSYIKRNLSHTYSGLNDRDLLQEFKNDSFRNEKHIDFLEVSDLYMEASKKHIKEHPLSYIKNVARSSLLFFTPATIYPGTHEQVKKIRYYDAIYSFNLSHFAVTARERTISFILSSIPYILIYFFTIWVLTKEIIRTKKISPLNLFIIIILGYVFATSSLLEHYENMRFRFEIYPMFLLLFAQAVILFRSRRS